MGSRIGLRAKVRRLFQAGICRQMRGVIDRASAEEQPLGRNQGHLGNVR
jgi:hypothetical protein